VAYAGHLVPEDAPEAVVATVLEALGEGSSAHPG
jgi:hypothetical protein